MAEHSDKSIIDTFLLTVLSFLDIFINFCNSKLIDDNSILILFPIITLLSGKLYILPLPK